MVQLSFGKPCRQCEKWERRNYKEAEWSSIILTSCFQSDNSTFFLSNVQVSPFFYTQPLDHKPSIHPQGIALCIGRRIGTGREKGANWFEDPWTNCTQTNHCSDWSHDVPVHWTGERHTLSTHLKSPNYSVAPFYKQTWDSSYPIKTEHRSLAWKNDSFGDWNQIKLWK